MTIPNVTSVENIPSCEMLYPRSLLFLQKRWKGKKIHWAKLQKKRFVKDKALDNFDEFYGSVYGNQWKSIRAGLLTEHKYIAMVNNFGDKEKISNALELEGAINVSSLVNLSKAQLCEEDGGSTLAENNVYKLDQDMKLITQTQQHREISALYPSNVEITKDSIHPNNIAKSEENPVENVNDFNKKSLEKALEEDVELDERRLIDEEYGTGGLHEYIPATKIKGLEDWVPESTYYKYYSTSCDFPLSIELEKKFTFPENLHLYTYEKGNCSEFMAPKKCLTGVFSHYLMDGASILPPLLLDIQFGDRVLDACAAPGGKSLLMLQTLLPEILVSNDNQESRVNRIKRIMEQYFLDYDKKWKSKHSFIIESDARVIEEYNMYDKILVDVPCTTDRHSVMENDNNIFKSTRIKERLRIPELQSAILTNCLRLLKPGGSLVYSTCSLSPIQNDGVVHMSLQKAFNDYGITTTIKDLSFISKYFGAIFKFQNPKSLKYGQLVLPFLPANFGPMYYCKITRNK